MKFKYVSWLKRTLVVFAVVTIGVAIWFFTQRSHDGIQDFVDSRDAKEVVSMFKRDLYWLSGDPDASPEFIVKYRTPSDTRYLGRLIFKVLREQGDLVGFIAYFMKNQLHGQLLFLDVKPEFRGKGYAEKLVRYALQDFKRLGAKEVGMWTRIGNERARSLYKRLGFKELFEDDGFIYMTIDV